MKKLKFTPEQRICQFLRFCRDLEEHPFFMAHQAAGSFRVDFSLPESGNDEARLNFDEAHLETFLTRERQFLFKGELFFYKDLKQAVVEVFGDDHEFEFFVGRLDEAIQRRFSRDSMRTFKRNGDEVLEGRTLSELVAAYLYSGPIHSERILSPKPGSAEDSLYESNVVVKKVLAGHLAAAAMVCASNIFALRAWILRRARSMDAVTLCPELEDLHARSAP